MNCHTFDASSLRCPLPLIKTKQKMRELAPGETLLVITQDKSSLLDFKVYAELCAHELMTKEDKDKGRYYFYLKKGHT